MWSALSPPIPGPAPSARSKHSVTLHNGFLYLLGGRNGNLPLKDFWRYSLATNRWEELRSSGDTPSCLQEHSAVAWQDHLYVFGGELGFSGGSETPLWIYNIKKNEWRKWCHVKGQPTPTGRRGHTALVAQGSMLIYGGYQDLRGSSGELWAFHFEAERWYLLSRPTGDSAPARHKHSSVLHDGSLWVFGGMTDLQERNDLWKCDLASRQWTAIRSRPGPGCLHSHVAVRVLETMLVFGGERSGQTTNELWRFHFGSETWEKVQLPGLLPQPRAQAAAFVIDRHATTQSELPSIIPQPLTPNVTRRTQINPSALSHITPPKEKEKKYVFQYTKNEYVDGSESPPTAVKLSSSPERVMLRAERRGPPYVRVGPKPTEVSKIHPSSPLMEHAIQPPGPGQNLGLLKELSRMSQRNISRLAHTYSYSVLSEDSTESLSNAPSEASPSRLSGNAVAAGKMVKSQSAYVFGKGDVKNQLNKTKEEDASGRTVSIPSRALANISANTPLSRDNASVPNFGVIQVGDVETKRQTLVSISDSSEDEDEFHLVRDISSYDVRSYYVTTYDVTCEDVKDANPRPNLINVLPSQQGNTGSPRRSESANNLRPVINDQCATTPRGSSSSECPSSISRNSVPKSASVRFGDQDQPNRRDEMSSTSDYASFETVNTDISHGQESREETQITSSYGFSNPNYLGLELNSTMKNNNGNTDAFQQYAQLLNSPPDSLLEGTLGMSYTFQDELELTSLCSPGSSTAYKPFHNEISEHRLQSPAPNWSTTEPVKSRNINLQQKKRASSASRAETISRNAEKAASKSCEHPAYVFVIGGKEVGQVTVFKRAISIWRLLLTPELVM